MSDDFYQVNNEGEVAEENHYAQEGPGLFDELADDSIKTTPTVTRADDKPGLSENTNNDIELSFNSGDTDFSDADNEDNLELGLDEPANNIDPPLAAVVDLPQAQLALYRRYRPDTFEEIIGQDHVTAPLQRALVNNRVNHAYLFSGPRGCGKTTSARILARCLNCAEGPTPTPCGVCESCRDLARGGPGSIDVIEIDAASHGGVDDARDLRERAFFAPVNSRFKIYIVDEAHMVTTAGFNAMLKLVEEPPPHVKFIFATTEPEKVIGTIRSRTHHYPFRLVPPKILITYLEKLCDSEGVKVDHNVLPLVVRAGAGSVRDSLSVLDQLLGGAAQDGVSYQQATALLGYTPSSLLDDIMNFFAAKDAKGVFSTIDRIIEIGQDPRRFAEDLLSRLRDLMILSAVPEAVSIGLLDIPEDQGERLSQQALKMGSASLTRASEIISAGITQMRGTVTPRLHLELMCSRVLLPENELNPISERIKLLEQRFDSINANLSVATRKHAPDANLQQAPLKRTSPQPTQRNDAASDERSAQRPNPTASPLHPAKLTQEKHAPDTNLQQAPLKRTSPQPTQRNDAASDERSAQRPNPTASPLHPAKPAQEKHAPDTNLQQAPLKRTSPQPTQRNDAASDERSAQRPNPTASPLRPAKPAQEKHAPDTAQNKPNAPANESRPPSPESLPPNDMQKHWHQILEAVKNRRRYTWMLLSQNAKITHADRSSITITFANAGARDNFELRGSKDIFREALIETTGLDVEIKTILNQNNVTQTTPKSQQTANHSANPAYIPDPEAEGVSMDDQVIDDKLSANELLTRELGAEIISQENN